MFTRLLFYLLSLSFFVGINGDIRVAIARLVSTNVTGNILFTETDEGIHVTGSLTGLAAGHYGFHVHQLGDITTCDTTGPHFNPDDTDHGGRDQVVRHVGDLGNVEFVAVGNESAVAAVDFKDTMIALRGRYSILGRALVLHENEDDLGLGGHELSLTTGNAGARVACGVIGIVSPVDPWNSATVTTPSFMVLVTVMLLAIRDSINV